MSNDRFKMAGVAVAALQRIRNNRETSIRESNAMRTPKSDFSRMIFEEYDEKSFAEKVKVDSIFYRTMLKNMNESEVDGVRQILTNYFDTVRQIYEHINIKPRVYGFNLASAFNESDAILEESATRMLNDFVNQQYYSLSSEERESRYFPAVKGIASDVILKEHVSEEEAVEFGSKSVVLKEFIERISFPLVVKTKIEEDLIDENYGKIFDQSRLKDLWNTFQDQATGLSKIVAAVV